MLDADALSARLEAAADPTTAKKRGHEVKTLRGVRGVPFGEIAKIGAETWNKQRPTWDDESELSRLFGTAWEDGLLAIGLLACILPDSPTDAVEMARDWLARVDDHATADALGWLVLGPALLASGAKVQEPLITYLSQGHPTTRRAAVMALMGLIPVELEGPSAAPLRARLGREDIQFVDEPQSAVIHAVLARAIRDEDPGVRKAVRRVLTAWGESDPQAAEDFLKGTRGGMPKMFREAIEKAIRKARRTTG